MKKYLKLMRVHHWIKNILVITPIVFSGQLFDINILKKGFLGVLSFSLVSSLIYIINDMQDVEKDRRHPTKCKRPLASGDISIKNAKIMIAIILCSVIIFGVYMTVNWNISIFANVYLLIYFILNIGYSMGLKNKAIIDIVILVSGFLLRVLYGSVITNIGISDWLYLTVIAGAFFFALGKRRNELALKGDTREVLKYYNKDFLDKNMYVCLALLNVFYALWSRDNLHSDNMIWTVPIVLVICMRYSMDVEGDSDGDPVEVLVKDKILLGLCAVYALMMFAFIYMPL